MAILPALIGGALGIGSSLISGNANRRAQDTANARNLEMMNLQNQHQKEFWQMQNAYNHPSEQMKRLREAGLNPNMVMGKGGMTTGNASPLNAAKAPEMGAKNALQDLGASFSNMASIAQTDNLRAQNQVIQEEALLKSMEQQKVLASTARTKQQTAQADEAWKYNLEAYKLKNQKTIESIEGSRLSNQLKAGLMKPIIQKTLEEANNARKRGDLLEYQKRIDKLNSDLAQYGIRPSDSIWTRLLIGNKDLMMDLLGKVGFNYSTLQQLGLEAPTFQIGQ